VKTEIQTMLGLHPSEYILQVSDKSTKLTFDDCTLADYNIHKDTTLEIKLLHPTAEPRVGLNGGAVDNKSSDSKVSNSGDGDDDDSKKKTANNQEAQATPTSTNVNLLSIPGAFAQHSQCSNKRCNDTRCSSNDNESELPSPPRIKRTKGVMCAWCGYTL